MSFLERALQECASVFEATLEETIKKIIAEYDIPPQEIGAVPGEYHPVGTVIEGTITHPIEDERRLLQ